MSLIANAVIALIWLLQQGIAAQPNLIRHPGIDQLQFPNMHKIFRIARDQRHLMPDRDRGDQNMLCNGEAGIS